MQLHIKSVLYLTKLLSDQHNAKDQKGDSYEEEVIKFAYGGGTCRVCVHRLWFIFGERSK